MPAQAFPPGLGPVLFLREINLSSSLPFDIPVKKRLNQLLVRAKVGSPQS
jgi:hypothetical protein